MSKDTLDKLKWVFDQAGIIARLTSEYKKHGLKHRVNRFAHSIQHNVLELIERESAMTAHLEEIRRLGLTTWKRKRHRVERESQEAAA